MVIDGLKKLELKPNDNSNQRKYGLETAPLLRKYLLDYLFHFLLLPYSTSNNTANVATAAATAQVIETPACLSEVIYKRFKNDLNLEDGDQLEQVITELKTS